LTGLVERRRLARRANFGLRAKKGGTPHVLQDGRPRQRWISGPHPYPENGFTLFCEVVVSALM
jgi:hypothetical protein